MHSLLSFALLGCLAITASGDRGSGSAHASPIMCNKAPDGPPNSQSSVATKRFARALSPASYDREAALAVNNTTPFISLNYNALAEIALFKRAGTITYDANCNDPLPHGSSWAKLKQFPTKKSVIQEAYMDAVTLAMSSQSIAADLKAFSHYFGGTKTDIQLTHFRAMMAAIASHTIHYNVKFECSGKGGDCRKYGTAANTDTSVGSVHDVKSIWICEGFWTGASTRFLLTNKEHSSPPYRPKSDSGWCKKDKDGKSFKPSQFFTTAGHTILHELTHLDPLAKHAGLEAPTDGEDQNRHGTDDPQKGYEVEGARQFLEKYKADSKFSPDYNAESYAAAATEKYFTDLCGFKEIK